MNNALEEGYRMRDGHVPSIECWHMINERSFEEISHYHDYIEILYMFRGTGCVYTENETIEFSQGDMVVINSNKPHDVSNAGALCEYEVIKIKPQILYSADYSLFEIKYMMPFVTGDNPVRKIEKDCFGDFDIKTLMKSIDYEWENGILGYEMSIRSDVLRLFTWMIRYLNDRGEYDAEQLNYLSISTSAIKKLLLLAFDDNMELSCAQAAKFCNMSYSYFSRVFKQLMGMSYTSYLTQIRLNKAERLLATTDNTVTQVASDCGFSSDAYFVKCFRRAKGTTPGQYRARFDRRRK